MKYLLCNEVSHFFGPHLSTWFWPFSHIFEEFWIRSLMEIFPVFLLVVFINSYHVVFRHQHYQLLHRSSFCPAMPNTSIWLAKPRWFLPEVQHDELWAPEQNLSFMFMQVVSASYPYRCDQNCFPLCSSLVDHSTPCSASHQNFITNFLVEFLEMFL